MPLSSALPQDIQTQSFAFAMDLGIVLRQLLQEVQDLREEKQQLSARVEALEDLQELYHGPMPDEGDRATLKEDLARQKDALTEKVAKPKGKKTRRRIEKLKELLKGYGGSQTFEQLQIDLNLSPSQFSQLVRKLDKRVFEIAYLPGGKKGEKVLKLRAVIGETFEAK